VDLLAYRSHAHTPATDPDDPNVERDRLGGMTTMALTGEEVLTRARHTFVRFTRSLERCDPAFHKNCRRRALVLALPHVARCGARHRREAPA
jgi:hypothetical protein